MLTNGYRLTTPPVHAGLVSASLAGMRAGGSFVELAKRDIWSAVRVAQERPDVAYALLAVDFLPAAVLRDSLRAIGAQVRSAMFAWHRCQKSHSCGRYVTQIGAREPNR